MTKKYINADSIWSVPALNHAVRVGNTIYFSGQVAWDKEGKIVGPGDIRAQASKVYENIRAVLKAGGASMSDVVSMITFCTHPSYGPVTKEIRTTFGLKEITNTFIVTPSLAEPGLLMEVQGIAVVDD